MLIVGDLASQFENTQMQSSSEFSLPNSLNEAQLINEEYKIWKKYTPFYYDLMLNNCLEFPSLTIEWSPTLEAIEDQNYKHHRLILGTHTGTAEPNYLLVGKVGRFDPRSRFPKTTS